VGCVLDGERLEAAGGFIIQHMPGAPFEKLAQITARLSALPDTSELLAETAADPEQLLARVLGDIAFDILQRDPICFGCNCSTDRFLSSLATLGRTDLEDILAEGEPLDITCDYCTEEYRIPTTRLRTLLEAI
jgi:molecular chaperone Hsp33